MSNALKSNNLLKYENLSRKHEPRQERAAGHLPLVAVIRLSSDPTPVLIGESQEKIAKGDGLFRKAQAKEAKGDHGGAIKLYDEVADDYAFSTHAGEARYRQANATATALPRSRLVHAVKALENKW